VFICQQEQERQLQQLEFQAHPWSSPELDCP